ncbi:GatB/YqeY domain-containing protein [Saccharomonospora sp. NPDC006951]
MDASPHDNLRHELRAGLRESLKAALKAKDRRAAGALRSALAAVDNAEAVPAGEPLGGDTGGEHVAGAAAGLGATEARRRELTGADVRAVVENEVRERRAAALEYERLGRADAAERLRAEADVLDRHLEPGIRLPPPSGPRPVGVITTHLVDTSRPDPWEPSAGSRELMVSVFHPAASSASGEPGMYLTAAESRAVLAEAGIDGIPGDVLSTVRGHAIPGAEPWGERETLPLVVLSPGFKRPRATLTSLAEDLASHEYVVAVVDHTYENVATTFPDGRVAGCAACGKYDPGFWRKLRRGRAADVSFVLDELTSGSTAWSGAGLIDPSRIAMAGHSAGGASVIPAMLGDSRITAGVDIDGTTGDLRPGQELSRPFLFLGRQNTYAPGTPGGAAETWEHDWPLLTGWKRWLVVAGMAHPSFTDLGIIGERLGLDFAAAAPALRGAAITRACVRAFLDLHLRGTPQPLLSAPVPEFPEVVLVG